MSVLVRMIGRLGNNMFQYALGRIIAQRLGMELNCIHIPLVGDRPLNLTASMKLGDLKEYFPNAPLQLPGLRFEAPIESFELRQKGEWGGQILDLKALLLNKEPRQIRLLGWFQRFEYYAPYREELGQWFAMPRLYTPYRIHPNDVLVNVRHGTDFAAAGWILPVSYYLTSLKSFSNIGRVYVCGTCIDQGMLGDLRQFRPILYRATPIQHFSFMQRFNRIILSNSTFAWWAAFLSDANQIIAPRSMRPGVYGFAGFPDVDLNMQHRRYREICVS